MHIDRKIDIYIPFWEIQIGCKAPFKLLELRLMVCGILFFHENNNNNNAVYCLIDVWTTMNHSISFMVYAKSYRIPSACSDPFNVRVFLQALMVWVLWHNIFVLFLSKLCFNDVYGLKYILWTLSKLSFWII